MKNYIPYPDEPELLSIEFNKLYGSKKFKFLPENFVGKRNLEQIIEGEFGDFINTHKEDYEYFALFRVDDSDFDVELALKYYKLFKKFGVDAKRVVLIISNFCFGEVYDKKGISNEIRFNIVPCFLYAFMVSTGRYANLKNKIDDYEKNLHYKKNIVPSKLFLCTNSSSRPHRNYFIRKLKENDLMKFGHVSYIEHEIYLDYPDSDTWICSAMEKHEQFWSLKDFYNDSLFTIVNESDFYIGHTNGDRYGCNGTMTEKSVQPVLFGHPFFVVGPKNSIGYLKEFGFQTFDEFWSEDYNKVDDVFKKGDLVIKELLKLSKMSKGDIMDMKKKVEEVTLNNFYTMSDVRFMKWEDITERFFGDKLRKLNLI